MNQMHDLSVRSVRSQVSPEEWQQRVNLAAAYRLVALYGWDDIIFTHLSARVPGPEHHFLINPYGLMFEEVTASSLVKIDLDGNKVMDSEYDINPAGFTIHSAIHAAREDAHAVFHVHTPAGVAVSAQADGVLPISQQSIFVIPQLAYHDYEGVALRDEEKPRLCADLGMKRYLMLRNHGTLTVARDVRIVDHRRGHHGGLQFVDGRDQIRLVGGGEVGQVACLGADIVELLRDADDQTFDTGSKTHVFSLRCQDSQRLLITRRPVLRLPETARPPRWVASLIDSVGVSRAGGLASPSCRSSSRQ